MLRRDLLTVGVTGLLLTQFSRTASAQPQSLLRVVRDPGCDCCAGWARHMEQNGFDVRMEERPRTHPLRRTSGAPPGLVGCHVGLLDQFAFEGHVPAAAVRRFLADPGSWRGLAVPGMPVGSPGMEIAGTPPQAYDVVRFDLAGRSELYARARGGDLV